MESLISKTTLLDLEKMIDVGSSDDQAELEIKVLAGQIQTSLSPHAGSVLSPVRTLASSEMPRSECADSFVLCRSGCPC